MQPSLTYLYTNCYWKAVKQSSFKSVSMPRSRHTYKRSRQRYIDIISYIINHMAIDFALNSTELYVYLKLFERTWNFSGAGRQSIRNMADDFYQGIYNYKVIQREKTHKVTATVSSIEYDVSIPARKEKTYLAPGLSLSQESIRRAFDSLEKKNLVRRKYYYPHSTRLSDILGYKHIKYMMHDVFIPYRNVVAYTKANPVESQTDINVRYDALMLAATFLPKLLNQVGPELTYMYLLINGPALTGTDYCKASNKRIGMSLRVNVDTILRYKRILKSKELIESATKNGCAGTFKVNFISLDIFGKFNMDPKRVGSLCLLAKFKCLSEYEESKKYSISKTLSDIDTSSQRSEFISQCSLFPIRKIDPLSIIRSIREDRSCLRVISYFVREHTKKYSNQIMDLSQIDKKTLIMILEKTKYYRLLRLLGQEALRAEDSTYYSFLSKKLRDYRDRSNLIFINKKSSTIDSYKSNTYMELTLKEMGVLNSAVANSAVAESSFTSAKAEALRLRIKQPSGTNKLIFPSLNEKKIFISSLFDTSHSPPSCAAPPLKESKIFSNKKVEKTLDFKLWLGRKIYKNILATVKVEKEISFYTWGGGMGSGRLKEPFEQWLPMFSYMFEKDASYPYGYAPPESDLLCFMYNPTLPVLIDMYYNGNMSVANYFPESSYEAQRRYYETAKERETEYTQWITKLQAVLAHRDPETGSYQDMGTWYRKCRGLFGTYDKHNKDFFKFRRWVEIAEILFFYKTGSYISGPQALHDAIDPKTDRRPIGQWPVGDYGVSEKLLGRFNDKPHSNQSDRLWGECFKDRTFPELVGITYFDIKHAMELFDRKLCSLTPGNASADSGQSSPSQALSVSERLQKYNDHYGPNAKDTLYFQWPVRSAFELFQRRIKAVYGFTAFDYDVPDDIIFSWYKACQQSLGSYRSMLKTEQRYRIDRSLTLNDELRAKSNQKKSEFANVLRGLYSHYVGITSDDVLPEYLRGGESQHFDALTFYGIDARRLFLKAVYGVITVLLSSGCLSTKLPDLAPSMDLLYGTEPVTDEQFRAVFDSLVRGVDFHPSQRNVSADAFYGSVKDALKPYFATDFLRIAVDTSTMSNVWTYFFQLFVYRFSQEMSAYNRLFIDNVVSLRMFDQAHRFPQNEKFSQNRIGPDEQRALFNKSLYGKSINVDFRYKQAISHIEYESGLSIKALFAFISVRDPDRLGKALLQRLISEAGGRPVSDATLDLYFSARSSRNALRALTNRLTAKYMDAHLDSDMDRLITRFNNNLYLTSANFFDSPCLFFKPDKHYFDAIYNRQYATAMPYGSIEGYFKDVTPKTIRLFPEMNKIYDIMDRALETRHKQKANEFFYNQVVQYAARKKHQFDIRFNRVRLRIERERAKYEEMQHILRTGLDQLDVPEMNEEEMARLEKCLNFDSNARVNFAEDPDPEWNVIEDESSNACVEETSDSLLEKALEDYTFSCIYDDLQIASRFVEDAKRFTMEENYVIIPKDMAQVAGFAYFDAAKKQDPDERIREVFYVEPKTFFAYQDKYRLAKEAERLAIQQQNAINMKRERDIVNCVPQELR